MNRPSDRDSIRLAADALGLALGSDQVEALLAYAALLSERAVPLGMVSEGDSGRILERHVLDSLRAAPAIRELATELAVDLGSGAGLPGVVLAIALPRVRFVLAEVRTKRAAFIELVVERLRLTNAAVHVGRAQDVGTGFGVGTARAFAPLAVAWDTARRVLEPGGALIFFAGAAERLPESLPEARSIARIHPGAGGGGAARRPPDRRPRQMEGGPRGSRPAPGSSSPGLSLASSGDLVIITAT